MNEPLIRRTWAMPNSNTFSIKPIHELIDKYQRLNGGMWCDPFARNCHICSITNDINPNTAATYHLDALEFLKIWGDGSMSGVCYDPPYSPRQIKECYDDIGKSLTSRDTSAAFWEDQKKEIARIVQDGGYAISFGWNSEGIGKKYGFEIVEILLVAHGGCHNDTICTVERKVK